MICRQCGANVSEGSAVCPGCDSPFSEDPWVPPRRERSAPAEGDAPFGFAVGGSPRRVSLFSKAALALACIVPPVGLILGIVATISARCHKKRPGNFAVAISSIFTSMHVGIIWGAVVVSVVAEASRYDDPDYYSDPWAVDPTFDPNLGSGWDTDPANLQVDPELQKLLEQILKTPDGGVPYMPEAQAP